MSESMLPAPDQVQDLVAALTDAARGVDAARSELGGRTAEVDALKARLSEGLSDVAAAGKRLAVELGALASATEAWDRQMREMRAVVVAERARADALEGQLAALAAEHEALQERVDALEQRRWFRF